MNQVKQQSVIMLRGIPGSGKTTFAQRWCKLNPEYIRVNKDDIRNMILMGDQREKESLIVESSREIVSKALEQGYSVIVDDTNFNPIHEEWLKSEINFHNLGGRAIVLKTHTMRTPIETCIERDSKRLKPVGEKVIRKMHEDSIKIQEMYGIH